MNRRQRSRFRLLCLVMMWLFCFLPFRAAAKSTILKVGQSGAHLYLHDDPESEVIETLQPGDELIQVIQTIGPSTWYMVKTNSGRAGWVRFSDVEAIRSAEPAVEAAETVIRFGAGSTWIANMGAGRSLGGTWAGTIDRSKGTATGSWTVRDGANRIVLRGTWSAVKSSGEWRGAWRALVQGQTREHSGTWTAALPLAPDSPFAGLFERAVNQLISGAWRSADRSGRWSIRAVH